MLIGFNLAPVVANIYWPQDQWIALLVMLFVTLVGYHLARVVAPAGMREDGALIAVGHSGVHHDDAEVVDPGGNHRRED